MAERLPDEMIAEILSPALKVSEEMFSDTQKISPFASSTISSSAALLVCKTWLRVATPLLYHVVVIRSKAQAQALERTLRANGCLAQFIRMLRLEGGFGPAIERILKYAQYYITDIFLSFKFNASDSTAGLVRGLPAINPTRVIIWDDDRFRWNNHLSGLKDILEKHVVKKWTQLTRLQLPHAQTLEGLYKAKNLRQVSWDKLRDTDVPLLRKLANHSTLELIEVRVRSRDDQPELQAAIADNPRLVSLVRWCEEELIPEEDTSTTVPHTTNSSSFKPLTSSPQQVDDRIWSQILAFAMPEQSEADSRPELLSFLLVSKLFHRLALSYLYHSLTFLTESTLCNLADKLSATPALGLHVREIKLSASSFERNDGEAAVEIFRHTPRLTRLIGQNQPELLWSALEVLAETAGGHAGRTHGVRVQRAGREAVQLT
ncbi:hypothetical protein C8R46DRAFT_1007181, partial [Mycena filopes]